MNKDHLISEEEIKKASREFFHNAESISFGEGVPAFNQEVILNADSGTLTLVQDTVEKYSKMYMENFEMYCICEMALEYLKIIEKGKDDEIVHAVWNPDRALEGVFCPKCDTWIDDYQGQPDKCPNCGVLLDGWIDIRDFEKEKKMRCDSCEGMAYPVTQKISKDKNIISRIYRCKHCGNVFNTIEKKVEQIKEKEEKKNV